MIKVVYINSDGSVDAFDYDDCKIPHLSGDLTILHTVGEFWNCKSPTSIPEECRMINAKVYFKKANGDDIVEITKIHLDKLLKYIAKPKFKSPKRKSVFNKSSTEISFSEDGED